MAGDDGRGRRSRQTVAVVLILCCLASSLTCFRLGGLSKKVNQDRVVSEATVMEVRTGSILFNGKELDSQSGSATGNDGLLHIESDGTGKIWLSGYLLIKDAACKCNMMLKKTRIWPVLTFVSGLLSS